VTRRQLKKVIHHFIVAMTREKIGVTPSVASPGDTNPSDATVAPSSHFPFSLKSVSAFPPQI